ncbi:glycosyltransferase family 39 protein [Vampirovibrio chlorellavorus]|uniref:glycosyltransferase family 39 protein n=1 Tax=Vampirovibrio chlorellavorus TaxID=758823 RepID=UPI0026E976C3|nr:glycosyltransferase family 39 protein [Vampirovibrio chlorellavorus]
MMDAFEGLWGTAILYGLGWMVALWFGWKVACAFGAEKPSWWAWFILGLGLMLRLGWIAWTQPDPISDYEGYWTNAAQLASGDWTFDNIDKHPGIILLLTYSRMLWGNSYWPAWIFNLALSGWVMMLIYLLAKRLSGNRAVALSALALAAVQSQLIAYSALLASELPTLYFYLLLTWLILEAPRHSRVHWAYWAGTGVLLYCAVLTRSTALVFLPLTALVMLLCRRSQWKQSLKGLLVLGASAGLMLSTWLYHQYLLTGRVQLFWGGEIWLVSTTHYETESRLVSPPRLPVLKERIAQARFGKSGPTARLAELAEDKAWAMHIIKQDPLRYLASGNTRLRHILWTTSETGIRDTQWGSARLMRYPDKAITRTAEVSKQVWRIILILGLLGLIATVIRWPQLSPTAREYLILITGFISIWLGFHFLMAVASDRWAVQIIPFTLIFAAIGLTTLTQTLSGLVVNRSRLACSRSGQQQQ